MKKALALVLAALLLVSMAACTGTAPAATTAAAAETTAAAETEASEASAETESGKTYTVGICQLVQHPALDAATQGFKDALTEALAMPSPSMSRTPPARASTAPPSSMAWWPPRWT